MKFWRVNIVFQDARNMTSVIVPGACFGGAIDNIRCSSTTPDGEPQMYIATTSGTKPRKVAINMAAVAYIEDVGPASEDDLND